MSGTLQGALKRKRSAKSSDNSNGDAPPSKRAMKRKQILEEHGSLGALDAPKGKTKVVGNGLEWWDPEEQIWRPAAPHDDYRGEFILQDSMLGNYDIRPDHGDIHGDITTFASAYDQQHWNVNDRSSWGNIRDSEGNQVLFLLDKPVRSKEPESSGYMMHNGLIMLDPDDNPVKDWPGIPRCFSSKVEGGRIEALRRICGMTIPDFRARMPRKVMMKSGTVKPLFGLTSINQRLSRFRERNDCPPWLTREKVDALKKHTVQRLATYGAPPVSTAGLPPPSEYEVERRRVEAFGKNPEKAAGRSVSAEERGARGEQQMKRFQRLEAEEHARNYLPPAQLLAYQPVQRSYENPEPLSDFAGPLKRKYDDDIQDILDNQLLEPAQKRSRVASPLRINPDVPDFDFGFEDNSNTTQSTVADAGFEGDAASQIASWPEDLRFVTPRNSVEKWSIKTALLHTAVDFLFYHGESPPIPSTERSYSEQYQEIQSIHQSRWSEPTKAPQLVGIGEWLWSFSHVPMPELTEEIAGRMLGDPRGETTVPSLQSTVMNVGENTDNNEEPTWKEKGAQRREEQLMGPGNEVSRPTQAVSQDSTEEEIVRYEDPKMVEQLGIRTDEELLDTIEFDNFDLSAWEPHALPPTGGFEDGYEFPALPSVFEYYGELGLGQGL